jgi:post-segregation antitoxin (ccd killing protein)
MRTTIRLDDKLLRDAKLHALNTGQTLTAVIEAALRQHLTLSRQLEEQPAVELVTYGAHGVQPGVDLDNSADLLDLMERHDDPL